MTTPIKLCLAQLDFTVGAIQHNLQLMINAAQDAKNHGAHLIIFPELSLTSYPPEDLLLRPDFCHYVTQAITALIPHSQGIDIIFGYPKLVDGMRYNVGAWLQNGKLIAEHYKQKLPNYGVFDEVRYFDKGREPTVVEFQGHRFGLLVCEDLWYSEPIQQSKNAGAECIITINASPFSCKRLADRSILLKKRCTEVNLPIIYVNHIGSQDDLLFDGDSIAINKNGEIAFRAPSFVEGLFYCSLDQTLSIEPTPLPQQSFLEIIYQALVIGVRDYVKKNKFPGVLIGLSGGIDSALTLAIAVDALGPQYVTAVMMPSQYTAPMSEEDAKQEAETLGCSYKVIAIKTIYDSFMKELSPLFKGLPTDITEENLQSRIRGNLLMALSNKSGAIVLTTGNKSEMAVGYATLYGDMAGGYCVLKDVYKTLVYQLSHYRNTLSPVIPTRVIERAPSAELAPNQKDQDSLPDYAILDKIIDAYVEQDLSIGEMVAQGFPVETVKKVVRLIHRSEFKRRQAPPGPRITTRSFGRNRRYPITSGFLDLILK